MRAPHHLIDLNAQRWPFNRSSTMPNGATSIRQNEAGLASMAATMAARITAGCGRQTADAATKSPETNEPFRDASDNLRNEYRRRAARTAGSASRLLDFFRLLFFDLTQRCGRPNGQDRCPVAKH